MLISFRLHLNIYFKIIETYFLRKKYRGNLEIMYFLGLPDLFYFVTEKIETDSLYVKIKPYKYYGHITKLSDEGMIYSNRHNTLF